MTLKFLVISELVQITYLRHQWDLEILPLVIREYNKRKQREKKGRDRTEKDEEEADEDEVDVENLDPVQWKDQDHYALLGLGKSRYRASPQEIRKACKYRMNAVRNQHNNSGMYLIRGKFLLKH